MSNLKLQLLFMAIAGTLFSNNILAGDPPPAFLTSQTLTSQGYQSTIAPGSFLQLVNFHQNWNSWYHEVNLLNQNTMLPGSQSLKVSQAYLYKDLTNNASKDFQAIDEVSGKTITAYKGQKYIVTGSNNKGWRTHQIHFVDDEGALVDHKGLPTDSPRTYKTSQQNIDDDLYQKPIKALGTVQRTATKTPDKKPCPEAKPKRPVARPLVQVDLSKSKSSYEYLTNKRSELRANGYKSCMNTKERVQREFMSNHPYGKLSLDQRADKILSEANSVLSDMKKTSGSKNSRNKSRYKDFVNGHYIDPVVSPKIAACIAYQETKGNLNPFAVNYTLCNTKMRSTAHGLGQITRSVMNGLRDNPDGDLLPLTTPTAKKYSKMSTRQIHSKMSGDTGMQLEVMMRILSSNAKFIRWKHKGLTEAEILRRSVIQYDRDAQSEYLQNVMKNCLPCLQKGGDGKTCYKTVK